MKISSVQQTPVVTTMPTQDHVVKTNESSDSTTPVKEMVESQPSKPEKKEPYTVGTDEEHLDDEMIKKSVEQANKTLAVYDKYIEREVHEVTHTVMYKLRDSKTKEVIREFPPKKIQDMIAKMWELAGLFIDERR